MKSYFGILHRKNDVALYIVSHKAGSEKTFREWYTSGDYPALYDFLGFVSEKFAEFVYIKGLSKNPSLTKEKHEYFVHCVQDCVCGGSDILAIVYLTKNKLYSFIVR